MKVIWNVIKNWAARRSFSVVKGVMSSTTFEESVTDYLNKKLDLPGLDEQQEKALIKTVLEAAVQVLSELILKKINNK